MPVRRRTDEGGAIAILVAVFALVMFGFAAIVVDLGMARVTKADCDSWRTPPHSLAAARSTRTAKSASRLRGGRRGRQGVRGA